VERLRFAAAIGDTGPRVPGGVFGMTKANGAGVVKEFWPTGAGGGVADAYEIWAEDARHLLLPSDYYVDANNAGRRTDSSPTGREMPNWPGIEAFVDGVMLQTFGEPVDVPAGAGLASRRETRSR